MQRIVSLIFLFFLLSQVVKAQEDVRIELLLPFDGLTCSTDCYVPIDTSTKFLKLRAFSSVEGNKYKISDAEVSLYRKERTINYTLIKSNNITLNRLGHREYGDLIIIKIQKVLRANSKNEITTVDRFFPKTITIPVNISE
tara:strand:+ start:1181 stop:1603 length:423 start_codon:yes stop_codon:yes gene_type:complete